MCKDVSYRSADCHCCSKLTQIRSVFVPVDGAIFMAEYFQPQMNCRNSQDTICASV